ncbi:MAG: glycine cleavage system protein GcvH [Candidatus Tectomicrobia bacterium]|uniref:Glycine cleavage system H protein n=1 Tax=Tectimicrobiota bacterium TaxID=2528274 RepID=A0A932FZG6_UNCTE|nr:glycine cleavage system protein GcvH [Candidatus Tectomicrobia bacterium]
MAIIHGCELPENLYYNVEEDTWARLEEDGTVTVGMTCIAATRAGKILYVSPKKEGKQIPRGKNAGTVESNKWVGPVPSPISGQVIAANEGLRVKGILVNQDPYGAGWIIRIRPSNPEELAHLLTGEAAMEAYRRKIEDRNLHCIQCAEE